MGASRRLFVRSDEEDEGGGDVYGDGAGPSTSSAARKSRKLSARQVASESHQTTGKDRIVKRLKRTVEKEAKDSDSDWVEESSDCEEIPETAWREKWSKKKEDKEGRGESSKRSSKGIPMPSVSARKRKSRLSSAQKTSNSKTKCSWYDDRFNKSTQKQSGSDAHILLGEDFEELLFEEALNASKETYTKEIDLPERFQMHEEILTETESRDDWTKEAHWIYDKIFGDSALSAQDEDLKCIADIDKEKIIKEVVFVLMQLHVEKCEVPAIGMYKFQECTYLAKRTETNDTGFEFGGNSLRMKSFKALWMVFQWDRKWLSLLSRKKTQQETWKSRAATSKEIGSAAEDRMLNVLVQALEDADSEMAVDDLDAKFNLQFPIDEKAPPKGEYKRPKRQSFYSLCCKSGLRSLVTELGLTPEQLGENLYALQKIHEPFDSSVGPESFDLSCASGQFTDLQSALAGARHVAAYELTCEPTVRNFVRSLFYEHAVVSTRPTSKGKALIDAFHEFSCVKHVQAKSVKSFNDAEWLLIQKAEEDELLEVFIELSQEVFDGVVMQSLQEKYFSSAVSEVAEFWNEQRKLTLREALSQMLLPLLAKEMRLSLTTRAKAWVQAKCCKSLWKRVSMAPYPNKDPFADVSTSSKAGTDAENAAVLACCWGSRNPPTTFVMLNAFGDLVDTLQTGYLNVHPGSHEQQLQRKLDDQERLKKFILLHKPNVVVVGAVVNVACRHLKDTIAETVGKAAEENSALASVPVIYGDESLASLYEKSRVSLMQLPKQPSIIRRAVALGRNLQDPLALIAALCNPSKDIVALSMHPMQRFLSAEEIYNCIECVMISVTNQVGVDVNLAVTHEWFFSPLQFVCGLGWKKASKLQQLIQDSGWLQSRESLLSYPFSLKDVVFKNCSGFLRIRRVGQAISGLRKLDPLDDTRIHPDYYELARDLAIYAFTNGKTSLDGEIDMDMVEEAIVHFRKNPETLTEETVTSFFNSLQDIVNIEILKDIRAELLCGFSDYRVPYSQPTQDEEFSWLTGEDDTSLCTGKAVNAIVQKVFRHRVICILESGIRGVLEKEDFTSDSNVDLTQVFSEGSSLTCCIASVLKDQFLVQVTCLGNNTEAHDYGASESPARRVPFSEEAAQKLGLSNPREYRFKPRDIHHPLFQNVSISDAIKALSDENPGKVIFHPSSEGPACLSMTLKCQDNVHLQKEIEEFEKDSTDLATFSQLGNVLKIDGRKFSTLDEVVTSYASPLISKMNEVLQSGQFQSGSDGEIRSFLNQKKQASTDSLVNCFSLCPNNPGAIAIVYMVDDEVFREKVDLYPEGFGLQHKMFRKIDTVVNYVKKAVNDASSRWVGRDEERDKQRGDGTIRGRGGRFGSGRRGRGYQGRGGRGNSSSGKWGAQERESSDWNFAGSSMNEQKKQEEQGFNNWAAEETNGWNDQKASFEATKSQDESGWGVADGVSEHPQSGWGADDAMNTEISGWGVKGSDTKEDQSKNENQDPTGCHVGDEKSGNGNDAGFEANKGQNESGWGDANMQLDKGYDSKNTERSGWGAPVSDMRDEQSKNEKCGRHVGEENGKTEGNARNGNGAGFEASKGQNHSGWGDANVQLDKGRSEWGAGDSKTDLTDWHVGEKNGETEGNRQSQNEAGLEASEGPNSSGWGDVDMELDKGQTGSGWGAKDSTEEPHIGWKNNSCKPEEETTKSQGRCDWRSGVDLLGTACVSGGDDINGQTGWGDENLQEIGSGNESRAKAFNSGKNNNQSGWGTPEGQLDSGWGGDASSFKNSGTASAPVSKTPEPCTVKENLTNESGWQAAKIQVDNGWGDLDSSLGKTQAGDGWGNCDVTSQKKDSGGGWANNGVSTSKVFDASGWGSSDVWKGEGTSGGSGTRTTGQWGASEEENKSGWKCSNDNWPGDNNQSGRGSFRGGQGWGRGRGRGGSSGWMQKEDDGGQGWGRGRGRGGSSGWAQKDDGGGQGWGRGRGRGGIRGWTQREDDGRQGWGRGRGRGGYSGWTQNEDAASNMERSFKSDWSQREDGGSGRGSRGRGRGRGRGQEEGDTWGGWSSQSEGGNRRGDRGSWSEGEGAGRGGWSRGEDGKGGGGCRGSWDGAGRQGRGGRGYWPDNQGRSGRGESSQRQGEDAGDNTWGSKPSTDDGWRGWKGQTDAGNINACLNVNSGWDVQKETDAGDNTWGSTPSNDDGWSKWKSSTDAGNVNACLNVNSGWDLHDVHKGTSVNDDAGKGAAATSTIEEECNISSKNILERVEEAEPRVASELQQKELNKESIEAAGDGIWGACEDLIDSNEMEGLITQKGPITNAPEPHHANVALQSGETIEAVLRGLENDGRSIFLAASMVDYAPSDKGISDAAIDDRSTVAESTESGKERLNY